MEEYKRPKFYVDYEKIKGTYKVNDKIKVTGIAKAYAGNNIDGAIVKYRVVRQCKVYLSMVILSHGGSHPAKKWKLHMVKQKLIRMENS